MATKVHMEALSPTMEEGQLVRWLKQEGDEIAEGDVLAEIETDKATMELVARGSGVLRAVKLKEGDTAAVGSVIATIVEAGEDVDDTDGDEATGAGAAAAAKDDAAPAERNGRDAASTARGKADDDEADEDEADEDGADEDEADEEGADEAAVARAISGEAKAGKRAAPHARQEPKAKERARAERSDGRVKASPLARRLAAEAGVELDDVEGSGPGGRITKRDIEAAAEAAQERPSAARPARTAEPAFAPPTGQEGPDIEEVPVSQMRKAIAKRLVQSIGPVPTFYLTVEIDMARIVEARERMNERLAEHDIKASVNDFIILAAARSLARHPEVNAYWRGDVIERHRRVHIGVAVAIEDGLITPIVRDAHLKGIAQIAQEVRELAGRARAKKLKPEEYTGATFSISNLGMFGIDEFTAIINPPESAILAIGRIEEKLFMEDGEVTAGPRMRITMSCDHRVIDGAMGARFLQTLREFLEEPMMILA